MKAVTKTVTVKKSSSRERDCDRERHGDRDGDLDRDHDRDRKEIELDMIRVAGERITGVANVMIESTRASGTENAIAPDTSAAMI